MRFLLAVVGRLKPGPERELCARYMARAAAVGRGLGLSELKVHEAPESRAGRAQNRMLAEAAALLACVAPSGRLIALDERGDNLTSAALAEDVRRTRDAGAPVYVMAIGGPDGLDPSVRAAAHLVLSFGALTWPHQLARVMAAEQIYRVMTILSGHPYHRG